MGRGPLPPQLQNRNKPTSVTKCQKCLKTGHHTYECRYKAPYIPRPSRSKQLAMDLKSERAKQLEEGPSVQTPEEFKGTGVGGRVGLADMILMEKEKARAAQKIKDAKREAKLKAKSGKAADRGRSRYSVSPSSASDSDSDSDSSRSRSPVRRARRRSTESRSPVRRSASPRR